MTDQIRTFRARLDNDPNDQEALEQLENLLFEGQNSTSSTHSRGT